MIECPHCFKEITKISEMVKFSLVKIRETKAEKSKFVQSNTSKWAFANRIFFTILLISCFVSLSFLAISLFQGEVVFAPVTKLSLIVFAVLFVAFAVFNTIFQSVKEKAGEIFDRTYPEKAKILELAEKEEKR